MFKLELARFRPIFGEPKGTRFLALFSKPLFDLIELTGSAEYDGVSAIPVNAYDIPEIISSLEEPHHVFCITSDSPFSSPPLGVSANIKLGVLPMFSTGFSIAKLEKALQVIFQIDCDRQYSSAKQLILQLEEADQLLFTCDKYGTVASMDLYSPGHRLFFFNQSGPITWGGQSMLPNGEVSILTNRHGEYSTKSKFALNGEIVSYGYPILHRGNCPCSALRPNSLNSSAHDTPSEGQGLPCPAIRREYVSLERQERIFRNLASMSLHATLFRIKAGFIEEICPMDDEHSFSTQLIEMIDSDERYRKIHEIGFGLNHCESFFLQENFLPNEARYGVHFGLGLTPYTEFHLDLACSEVSVTAVSGTNKVTIMEGGTKKDST